MKTAGIVLDLYDNPADLKAIFTSLDEVPEFVKSAHSLTDAERERLPDDVFALVLLNGADRLRKFACVDEGNTALNLAFFVKNAHKLPEEAQKVAAQNLAIACGWYGIEVPEEIEKVAFLGTAMTALTAPSLIKGTASKVKGNLNAVSAGNGAIVTPRQQQALGDMNKGAEVSGTSLAPLQEPGDLEAAVARKPSQSNTSAQKTAGRLLSPYVDVTNKEPTVHFIEKRASHYAYHGVFPLDDYAQVKTASTYFDDNHRQMPSDMKRQFAVELVKRASAMGIRVSDYALGVGSDSYAPATQLRVAIDNRLLYVKEASSQEELNRLYDERESNSPDAYCDALVAFDKTAGITHLYGVHLLDPIDSTFGVKKAQDENESWINGNDYITKRQIESYALTAGITLNDEYGEDFLKEFRKDAWNVFKSMPVEQKRRLARAATDNGANGMHDVA